MATIRFVDTTIRDGHQSLWAEDMTPGMMLPLVTSFDDAVAKIIRRSWGSHAKTYAPDDKSPRWNHLLSVYFRIVLLTSAGAWTSFLISLSASPPTSNLGSERVTFLNS